MKRILIVLVISLLALGCKKKEEAPMQEHAPVAEVTPTQGKTVKYTTPSGSTDVWVSCIEGVKVLTTNYTVVPLYESNVLIKCPDK